MKPATDAVFQQYSGPAVRRQMHIRAVPERSSRRFESINESGVVTKVLDEDCAAVVFRRHALANGLAGPSLLS